MCLLPDLELRVGKHEPKMRSNMAAATTNSSHRTHAIATNRHGHTRRRTFPPSAIRHPPSAIVTAPAASARKSPQVPAPDRRQRMRAVPPRLLGDRQQDELPLGHARHQPLDHAELGRVHEVVGGVDGQHRRRDLLEVRRRIVVARRVELVEHVVGVGAPSCASRGTATIVESAASRVGAWRCCTSGALLIMQSRPMRRAKSRGLAPCSRRPCSRRSCVMSSMIIFRIIRLRPTIGRRRAGERHQAVHESRGTCSPTPRRACIPSTCR